MDDGAYKNWIILLFERAQNQEKCTLRGEKSSLLNCTVQYSTGYCTVPYSTVQYENKRSGQYCNVQRAEQVESKEKEE